MAAFSWHGISSCVFRRGLLCGLAGLVLLPALLFGRACAAVPSGRPALADTLVVQARPLALDLPVCAATVTTRVELEPDQLAGDLAEVLGRTAGFQIRRYGGLGASAVPSLRGSPAAQVRVFIDGAPVPDAQTGSADLTRLPLERFAAVEIHRGLVPPGLGGIGGAGAVNLIPRRAEAGWELNAGAGSFGLRSGQLTWGDSGGEDRPAVLVLVHGARCENDYSFTDHLQTFHDTTDDTLRTRLNADFQEWGGWVSGSWETGGLRTRLAAGHFQREGGRPGPLGAVSLQARVRYRRSDVGLQGDLDRGKLAWRLAAGREQEHLFDPAGEIGFFTSADTTRSLSRDLTGSLDWWQGVVARPSGWFSGLDLGLGCEQQRQWFRQWIQEEPDPLRGRVTTAARGSATIRFWQERLQVLPSWRWQRAEDDFPPIPSFYLLPEQENVRHVEDSVSPGLGLVVAAVPGRLLLTGHAARTVRIPTWIELFGHRGGVEGNRDLQAEELTQADLGVQWLTPGSGLSVRGAVFQAETDRTIIYVQNSVYTSRPENFGLTRTRGFELEFSGGLPRGFRLAGNLTCQAARDRGDDPAYRGKHLPFLPDREAWLQLSRPRGDWRPSLELILESANYRDRYNTELNRAPARTIVTVGLARRWRSDWPTPASSVTVAGKVLNLTDNRVYDVEGYPLPGRTWQLGVRWQI